MFTPFETLLVIQHCEKRLDVKFSKEEIETGILKGVLTEADYDIIKIVSSSTYIFREF